MPLPLFVFIDESGNMDFSAKGTNHFVMTALMTWEPERSSAALSRLKYEFLANGADDQIPFHATENSVGTRKRACAEISTTPHFKTHTLWVDKHLTHPSRQSPEGIYAVFGKALGSYLLQSVPSHYEPIVLLFDSALQSKQKKAFLGEVKPALNALKRPYRIMFKPVKEDINGQIADYYAWAKFRELEHGDGSWLAQLPPGGTEFNLFRSGTTRWY